MQSRFEIRVKIILPFRQFPHDGNSPWEKSQVTEERLLYDNRMTGDYPKKYKLAGPIQ
ncbi:hypothetical protein J3R74_000679 [Puniceicoccus vermicola]